MKTHFDFLRISRKNTIGLLSRFDEEQLNHIPTGFNNNLAWHLGHLVVTQQLLNYGLSGLPMLVENDMVSKYRKGTKPESPINTAEIEQLNGLMISCVDQLETDYEKGIFQNFKTYPTSFNATLTSIEDSIIFNNIHEGLHLGYIMAMARLVR